MKMPVLKRIGARYLSGKVYAMVGILALTMMASLSARADLLQTIKDRGYITIGTEARYAPFEYIHQGKIIGYDRDLLKKIMEDLPGVKVKTLDLPFQGLLPGLSQGKLDFIVTAVSVTKARYERYALTVPVAPATVALMVRADDGSMKASKDIIGKTVGSQAGSGQLLALKLYDKSLEKKYGHGAAGIKTYVSYDEAYADLSNHRIDGVAQAYPNLLYMQSKFPKKYKVIEPPFGAPMYFSWAGNKGPNSKSLVDFFNRELKKLNDNGTMKKLQVKWFGKAMPTPDYLPKPTF